MVQPTNFPHILCQKTKQFGIDCHIICFTLNHASLFSKTLPGCSQSLQSTIPAASFQQGRIIASKLSSHSAFFLPLPLSHDSCYPSRNLLLRQNEFFWVFPKQVLIITKQGWDHVIAWCSNFPLVVPKHKTNSLSGNYSLQFAYPNFHPISTVTFLTV